jgi:hypothetical protein
VVCHILRLFLIIFSPTHLHACAATHYLKDIDQEGGCSNNKGVRVDEKVVSYIMCVKDPRPCLKPHLQKQDGPNEEQDGAKDLQQRGQNLDKRQLRIQREQRQAEVEARELSD